MPPWLRRFKDDTAVKIALVYQGDRLLVLRSLREWILQVIQGDHAGESKVKEMAESVFWPNKDKDIENKDKSCVTSFKSGKNLKTIIPVSEVNRDGNRVRLLGKSVQLDFVGPFVTNTGKKRFVLMAIDCGSIWPKAIFTKHWTRKVGDKTVTRTIQS